MQSQTIPFNPGVFPPGVTVPAHPSGGHAIWANEHLQDFAERMATHGMAVSCVRLRNDVAYTLRQLSKAQRMDDAALRDMVVTLFHQFLQNSSGIPARLGD